MAKFSFGNIHLGVGTQPEPAQPQKPGAPFHLLVLGDFTGRANRGVNDSGPALAKLKPRVIDRDNFEDVMAALDVKLQLTMPGADAAVLELEFKELDDFHPDRLYRNLEMFQALRSLRRRLDNPKTFADAAAEVRQWAGARAPQAPAPPPQKKVSQEEAGDLLSQMLEESTDDVIAPQPIIPRDWNAYIAKMVDPYLIPGTDPKQPEFVKLVDEATSQQMGQVLHHPQFQTVEAAWRSLFFLIKRLETDERLKVFFLDISQEELSADLLGVEDLSTCGLYKLLVEKTVGTPGAIPWAAFLGGFVFEHQVEQLELLGRLAQVAQAATAPFIASATSAAVGCADVVQTPDPDDWNDTPPAEVSEAWQALRSLPAAQYLGLTFPRFLLRLPYGKNDDPCDEFAYEEHDGGSHHLRYLWGSGALAAGCLLGQMYTQAGWNLQPGMIQELDNLPLHVYKEDGDSEIKACGEVVLSERAAENILKVGLMPVLTLKHQDRIRLPSFRSVSTSSDPLSGRWGG